MNGSQDKSNFAQTSIYELSAVELDAVHGGELKIEFPPYVPLSQIYPKTEVTLPRVPYR